MKKEKLRFLMMDHTMYGGGF
uniref:Uncharacterized protein n=1 Tax=Arundo donax TaxID=35708 RepID=A0A0A9AEX6_ARUDO